MATLSKKPCSFILDALGGSIDWGVWKGIFYVKKWPNPLTQTQRWLNTKNNLLNSISLWKQLNMNDISAWNLAASGSSWTGRDMMFSHTMRLGSPRGVFSLTNIIHIPGQIRILFKVIEYAEPLLRFNWLDFPRVSDFIRWPYVPYYPCTAPIREKIKPEYYAPFSTDGSYSPTQIQFFIGEKSGILFFYLDDPFGLTRYSTGVYHECFT